jgi:hypothetical protein
MFVVIGISCRMPDVFCKLSTVTVIDHRVKEKVDWQS